MGFLDRSAETPRDRFAARALRLARRAPGVVDARYDPEKFAIAVWTAGRGEPIWLFLSNVYGDCANASRTEQHRRLDRLVRIMAGSRPQEPWEVARARLRPVLRPVTFGQVGVAGMVPPISRPALPFLREFVVVDEPEAMTYVVPARLESWGVSATEVFSAARENLSPIAARALAMHEPLNRGLMRMIDSGDGYFTSVLLEPGWLAEASRRRGGRLVAFAPDTATVVLCDIADGLSTVYPLVEGEYREAVRGLSPVGYVADERGAVVPYAPGIDDPDHLAARRAEVVLAATEYDAQTQWLSREYAKAGLDVQVGPLAAAARTGTPPCTIAAWPDGVSTLLPEAEFVAFGEGSVGGRLVPWRAVTAHVDLRPEPLITPVRYRVDGWPPPDVMDLLLAQAVN